MAWLLRGSAVDLVGQHAVNKVTALCIVLRSGSRTPFCPSVVLVAVRIPMGMIAILYHIESTNK